ncbi:MAG: DUF3347 domain-containing protein [Polaribacter sp.]
MKHLRTTILVATLLVLTVTSCKNNQKNTSKTNVQHKEVGKHDASASTDTTIKKPTQKNDITSEIVDAYLQIKNGLVTDNKDAAAKGGKALLAAFSNFDMGKLSGDTHKKYMEIYENAKEQAEHIGESPLHHQREHFITLSTDINDLVSLLGTKKILYHDFCPMADDHKGAYWLSETKNIQNPYFGSKMMKCGSVKNQIN